ncbi:MAG: hypothetical protein V1933_02115 [Candidatus Omnitrophota bacterium]
MDALKTKSLENIERKMETLGEDSLRYRALESVKNFKTSWIALGQALYSVFKDKLYRDWGYLTFEAYTSKEIGIRKDTAMKLLRSYYFLEKEEPQYLKMDKEEPQSVFAPSYESVNALRLAKDKKELGEEDYEKLKEDVFEKGKDVREVKKGLTALIRQREELSPQQAREKRKVASTRRLLSVLKALKTELADGKLFSPGIIKDVDNLISKVEIEISRAGGENESV